MKIIVLCMLLITCRSFGCGSEIPAIFGVNNHPDVPFTHFAAGDLGIITPELATSYLVVAYRYLNHQPLTKTEQANVLSVWSDYFIDSSFNDPVCPLVDSSSDFAKNSILKDNFIDNNNLTSFVAKLVAEYQTYFTWRQSRLDVLDLPTDLPIPTLTSSIGPYDLFTFYSTLALQEDNIDNIDAGPGFNYLVLATKRLYAIDKVLDKQLNQQAPSSSASLIKKDLLSRWIKAQQRIFLRTISGREQAIALLNDFPEDIPPLLQDDIQYSIAASYFHDGTVKGLKTAARYFAHLADIKTYPWHEWANYLQYRALHSVVNHVIQDSDVDIVCAENSRCRRLSDKAYNGMLALSKNAEDQRVKDAATDYMNVIVAQTTWRLSKAYDALLHNILVSINKNNFSNLIYFFNHTTGSSSNTISLWLNDVIAIRRNTENQNRLATEQRVFKDAYHQWVANPRNLAWLWLAIHTIEQGDMIQQNALINAVSNIPPQDFAFIPLRIALIKRATKMHGLTLNVRYLVNNTLAALPAGSDFSATTFLLNAKAHFATSLTDLIEQAFFYPNHQLLTCLPKNTPDNASINYPASYIITDAASIINRLPASVLIQLADMPYLPDNYRPVIYANLWVRSILFEDRALEKAISSKAMAYNPVLTDTIQQMAMTNNADERQRLFLSALLHYPNLSPVINLKLYQTWRGDESEDSMMSKPSVLLQPAEFDTSYHHWLWESCVGCYKSKAPAFLSSAQKIEYQAQLALMNHLPSATTYISHSLVRLACRYPHDLRYAELLALFIQYTKYAEGGSKKAFMALKKYYPQSKWAKHTKYYY